MVRKTGHYSFSVLWLVVFGMLLISETSITHNFQLKKAGNYVFAWHNSSVVSIATNDRLFSITKFNKELIFKVNNVLIVL